jgi:hypothetical protein
MMTANWNGFIKTGIERITRELDGHNFGGSERSSGSNGWCSRRVEDIFNRGGIQFS